MSTGERVMLAMGIPVAPAGAAAIASLLTRRLFRRRGH